MVIGELNPKESKTAENFAPIQKFTASGGSVLLIKSKTEQIFQNIGMKLYCKSQIPGNFFFQKNKTLLTFKGICILKS